MVGERNRHGGPDVSVPTLHCTALHRTARFLMHCAGDQELQDFESGRLARTVPA